MTLYLVRHGRAQAGVEDLDPGLDELGHQQAGAVADALAPKAIARLVVSPMRRTVETMAPLALRTGILPEVREEVSEVFDPRMPSDQRSTMIGPFMQGLWATQPEELRAWRQRVVETVLDFGLKASAASTDLVVVSHYIAICVIIGEAIDDDHVVPVPVANASISSFEVVKGRLQLLAAGNTDHLPPDLVTGVNTALLGSRPKPIVGAAPVYSTATCKAPNLPGGDADRTPL